MRIVLIAVCATLMGCGARVIEGSGDNSGGVTGGDVDSSTPDTAADTAVEEEPSVDASPPPPDTHIATSLSACDIDRWGPPHASSFTSYEYMHGLESCDSSFCGILTRLDGSCTMQVQVIDETHSATLSAEDCTSLKSFLTGDAFLAPLEGTYGCFTTKSYPIETISVVTGSVGHQAKAGADCTKDPLPAHRACIQQVFDRYFPGTKL